MSLKDVSTHFAFGENWASYAAIIDEPHIVEAEKALIRLFAMCYRTRLLSTLAAAPDFMPWRLAVRVPQG
jgi:hypothetical protein